MASHPLLLLLLTGAGLYVARLWQQDRAAARQGSPHPRGLPGATDASPRAVALAVAGALGLLLAETGGEFLLGVSAAQSRMSALAALYSVCSAPIIEEIIFRGWLVVEHRGNTLRWAAAVGASVVFAALHPFLWQWEDAGFRLTLGLKGAFSTAIVFATSLWLYVARFASWNPGRSLLPCFAAHAAKNAGVVVVKAALGYVGGLW